MEQTAATEEEQTVDALYLGRSDNGSGHKVFKLSTKEPISVNRVTVIPTPQDIIDLVNRMGEKEHQPDGIQFSDMHGNITILDLDENAGDDDSNTSDASFTLDNDKAIMAEEELEVDDIHLDEELEADGFQVDHFMGEAEDNATFEDTI